MSSLRNKLSRRSTTCGAALVCEGGAIIGAPTLVNAIADALAPFGEVPLELPLTPTKLLSVIEGRNLTGRADHVMREPTAEMAIAGADIHDPSPGAAVASPASAQAAPAAAPADAPVDGDWNMVLATPMGPQEMSGHFETDGQTLNGYLSSPEGRQAFTGTAEGGSTSRFKNR